MRWSVSPPPGVGRAGHGCRRGAFRGHEARGGRALLHQAEGLAEVGRGVPDAPLGARAPRPARIDGVVARRAVNDGGLADGLHRVHHVRRTERNRVRRRCPRRHGPERTEAGRHQRDGTEADEGTISLPHAGPPDSLPDRTNPDCSGPRSQGKAARRSRPWPTSADVLRSRGDPFGVAAGVTGGDRLALVPELLATGEAELQLDAVPLEVDAHRDQREALLGHLGAEVLDLATVEEQAAAALWIVVLAISLRVLGDVDAEHPRLAVLDADIALAQLGTAVPERLDLGAGELDARLERLEDRVLV